MDPAIEALTIHPADWAALRDGFITGLAYDVALLAAIAVLGAVLFRMLGWRPATAQRLRSEGEAAARPSTHQAAQHLPAERSVVLIASGPYAIRLDQAPRRCTRRRVHPRRAAASVTTERLS